MSKFHKINYPVITALLFVSLTFFALPAQAGTLSCTVRSTSCSGGETEIFEMENTSNSHAGLSAASYNNLVCCSGVTGLGNSCSGTFATALKLSGTTNAHVRQGTLSDYPSATNACISVPSGGNVSVGYQVTNCSGFDTILGSMVGTTNSHVGNGSWAAGTTKICANATEPQSLSFSISDNSVGFGSLSTSSARYATGDILGSGTDTADAHTISVSTNASGGYVMTINGTTLACSSCGGATITAIGATAVASSPGTKQFGARLIVNSGTGSATSPYASANWAFDTASFPDQVASGAGDGSTTVFGARYIGNISTTTQNGSYSSALTYTVTATF